MIHPFALTYIWTHVVPTQVVRALGDGALGLNGTVPSPHPEDSGALSQASKDVHTPELNPEQKSSASSGGPSSQVIDVHQTTATEPVMQGQGQGQVQRQKYGGGAATAAAFFPRHPWSTRDDGKTSTASSWPPLLQATATATATARTAHRVRILRLRHLRLLVGVRGARRLHRLASAVVVAFRSRRHRQRQHQLSRPQSLPSRRGTRCSLQPREIMRI